MRSQSQQSPGRTPGGLPLGAPHPQGLPRGASGGAEGQMPPCPAMHLRLGPPALGIRQVCCVCLSPAALLGGSWRGLEQGEPRPPAEGDRGACSGIRVATAAVLTALPQAPRNPERSSR